MATRYAFSSEGEKDPQFPQAEWNLRNKFLGFRIKNQQARSAHQSRLPIAEAARNSRHHRHFQPKKSSKVCWVPPFDRFAVLSFQPINLIPKDQNNSEPQIPSRRQQVFECLSSEHAYEKCSELKTTVLAFLISGLKTRA